jgi:hypothetical protein
MMIELPVCPNALPSPILESQEMLPETPFNAEFTTLELLESALPLPISLLTVDTLDLMELTYVSILLEPLALLLVLLSLLCWLLL